MDLKTYNLELLEKTEKRLFELIPNTAPAQIYEPFRYIMSGGGKRIRPVLTMTACAALCGNADKALDAACAIEVMHNFTLVHDDIMDNSPIRRGKETIHQKWDMPIGILSGDTMVGYSYRFMNAYVAHNNYPRIIDALSTALIEVCEGQAYDMEFNDKKDVCLDDYILMISKKTAALLQACVNLGGLVAEADQAQLKALNDYAYALGIAFQIQDDLLDITADQSKFGKRIGQDIIEGKKTYLMLKAREIAADKEDVQLIQKFFDGNGMSVDFVPQVKAMYEKLGIFEIAQQEIEKNLNTAKNVLANLPQNEYVDLLLQLAESMNKRSF
jgi:geranylgeranyl diphosphate synthase type II